jgi:hypothetical protein
MKKLILGLLAASASVAVASCTDADIADTNISKAADNFEVMRRVVFYNGITDKYILSVEGLCSLGNFDKSSELSVTCKTGPHKFIKHFLGLFDNVTFFAEQLEDVDVSVSTYHYRVVFKPQAIIPDFDFKADSEELTTNKGAQ